MNVQSERPQSENPKGMSKDIQSESLKWKSKLVTLCKLNKEIENRIQILLSLQVTIIQRLDILFGT